MGEQDLVERFKGSARATRNHDNHACPIAGCAECYPLEAADDYDTAAAEIERLRVSRDRLFATFERIFPGADVPADKSLDWLEGWLSLTWEDMQRATELMRENFQLGEARDALAAALRLVDEHASGCSSQIDIPDPLPRRPCDCYLKQVDAALAQHAPGGEDDAD